MEPVDDNAGPREPGSTTHAEHLLEQYKLLVKTAESVSDRRARANSFLLTVNAGLLALYGTTFESFPWYTSLLLAMGGLLVAYTWKTLLQSYSALNKAKFIVIQEMELGLPVKMFADEWMYRHPKGIKSPPSFTDIEMRIPYAFAAIYIVLIIASLSTIARSGEPDVNPCVPKCATASLEHAT